jgi:hypothetical protein
VELLLKPMTIASSARYRAQLSVPDGTLAIVTAEIIRDIFTPRLCLRASTHRRRPVKSRKCEAGSRPKYCTAVLLQPLAGYRKGRKGRDRYHPRNVSGLNLFFVSHTNLASGPTEQPDGDEYFYCCAPPGKPKNSSNESWKSRIEINVMAHLPAQTGTRRFDKSAAPGSPLLMRANAWVPAAIKGHFCTQ